MTNPTPPTHPRERADETPFVCRQCEGPCRQYAGSVWQWTCRRCIAKELARREKRAARAIDRQRKKLLR